MLPRSGRCLLTCSGQAPSHAVSPPVYRSAWRLGSGAAGTARGSESCVTPRRFLSASDPPHHPQPPTQAGGQGRDWVSSIFGRLVENLATPTAGSTAAGA